MSESLEKIKFSNKFFMYHPPEWTIEYPVVDLIKVFNEHTLINYLYGKGNKIIKKYPYNHRLIGCDLDKNEDYSNIFIKGKVECIFLFYNKEGIIIKNLLTFAEKNKIPVVTYNQDYSINNVIFDNPKELFDYIISEISIKPFLKTFQDFNLLDKEVPDTSTNLNKCLEVLKQRDQEAQNLKDYRKIKYFDPHLKILNKAKKEAMKGIVIEPELNNGNNGININKFFKNLKR
jgi:hypothetical protein